MLEAEVTGGLEHPGIVPVYGLGTYGDGRPYYAMRFIRGDSLKEAIEHFHADPALQTDPGRRSLELRKLLRRFIDVCNAIDYAHCRGVLHRDIKPGNMMVGKHGETLVMDWGLAKPTGQSDAPLGRADASAQLGQRQCRDAAGQHAGHAGLHEPRAGRGRPRPTRASTRRLQPGSDTLLLADRPPALRGRRHRRHPARRAAGRLPPPRTIDPAIDRALEAVCLKAMALKPEDRYGSCRALAEDIERWMADEPVSAWREPFSRRARRWARRNRTAVAAAVVALVAGVVGLGAVAGVQAGPTTLSERPTTPRNGPSAEAKEAKQATDAALAQSEESRRQAEAVSTFLVDAFRSPDPDITGREVKVADVLDRASTSSTRSSPGRGRPRAQLWKPWARPTRAWGCTTRQ